MPSGVFLDGAEIDRNFGVMTADRVIPSGTSPTPDERRRIMFPHVAAEPFPSLDPVHGREQKPLLAEQRVLPRSCARPRQRRARVSRVRGSRRTGSGRGDPDPDPESDDDGSVLELAPSPKRSARA